SARRLLGGRSFVAPDPAVHPSKWSGTEITEEVAQGLLIGLADNPRLVYDPVAIARNLPDVRFSFDWPEHEPGTVTFINDSHGFRRLPEEDATGADLTVLVLGDSQTYGLVDNDETFTSLLERRLTASGDGRRWAVLNAAVAGTGPHEYRGSLELHLPVRPDLVVAVFFTGNDFLNALRVDSFLRKGWSGLGDRDAQERYSQARQRWRSQLAQGVGQAQQFTVHPEQGRYAVQVCRDVFLEMSGLCRAHGAALLVVMLPCKAVVDGDDDQATITQLLETLQLRREQLDVNRWLGQRLAAELRQAGVEAVDLHEALEGPHPPLFWRSDHHLNVEGHALVAEALLPLVAERLSSPP
ncbi:MAG TPA: SGNH/GDSL hydrolase family protein, partial [Planctomycetota bacterium]|nr:SGNH/GDSL hydrolase family protein [Planctomycetota bacterium]